MTYQSVQPLKMLQDRQDDERPGHDRLALVSVGRRVAVVAMAMPVAVRHGPCRACSSSWTWEWTASAVEGKPRGSPAKVKNHIRNM